MPISTLVVTAYCACTVCCGPKATGLTAAGIRPTQGLTVAASRKIPLGTVMQIAGQRFVVQDRLAKRYDSRVDVYFTRHEDARKFGKQSLTVKY